VNKAAPGYKSEALSTSTFLWDRKTSQTPTRGEKKGKEKKGKGKERKGNKRKERK